jgi:hypothetical protein
VNFPTGLDLATTKAAAPGTSRDWGRRAGGLRRRSTAAASSRPCLSRDAILSMPEHPRSAGVRGRPRRGPLEPRRPGPGHPTLVRRRIGPP